MKMYTVGGCVRDEILGLKSKDIDFTVVLDERDLRNSGVEDETDLFKKMVFELHNRGFKIHVEHPEHLTVRAQFPKGHPSPVRDADFVLARKEGAYSDGRRPDTVQPGTLHDDLARRDFTMNAIAKDTDGNLIDPFGGIKDIENKIIRAVGSPMERFNEDSLRMLRAVRFKVTKGFLLDHDIMQALHNEELLTKLGNVSSERVMDELNKMLHFDTLRSLKVLESFPGLRDVVFSGRVSIGATMKQKGRGGRGKIPNPAPTTSITCFGGK